MRSLRVRLRRQGSGRPGAAPLAVPHPRYRRRRVVQVRVHAVLRLGGGAVDVEPPVAHAGGLGVDGADRTEEGLPADVPAAVVPHLGRQEQWQIAR